MSSDRGPDVRPRRWLASWLICVAALSVAGCASLASRHDAPPAAPSAASGDEVVALTILQINDVYEITPVAGGTQGGLARVATVRRQLLHKNPNTLTILAGDMLNPSAMGLAQVGGERLYGRHLVDVMNAVGLDYATFGNHEFDLAKEGFLERLSESKAQWFSSNTMDSRGQPFPNVPSHMIIKIANSTGRSARVGLFGLTTDANRADYVSYKDFLATAREQVAFLRPQVDILIAVTHLQVQDDIRLVETVPGIDLVIGGHEHEDMLLLRGARLTPIAKADANARTVYVHDLTFRLGTRALSIESRVKKITAEIPEDAEVALRVKGWVEKAFAGFRDEGFEPERVVARTTESLDGTEASVRNQPTRLTELLARGMLASVPGAEWSVFNSGSIRIDDVIQPGPVTEYDVIRILPFGGAVVPVDMKGSLLQRVLDQGQRNKGAGGYLQSAGSQDQPIQPERTYVVAIAEFLLTGREVGLDFLKDNPDLHLRADGDNKLDVRRILIGELQRTYP